MWLRLGRSAWWLLPGTLILIVFAVVLTRIDSAFAGRAFAAYGGVYIVSSLLWLAVIERTVPRITDLAGAALCLAGSAVIFFGRS
jgi:small multidrug resistance family-3 protein